MLFCFGPETTFQYLQQDRMYTHVQIGANGLRGNSVRRFGPWGDGAFGCPDGKYSELELHSIKSTFCLVDNLWVDLATGTSKVA